MNWTSRSLPGKERLLDEQASVLLGARAPVHTRPLPRPEERNQLRATVVLSFKKHILPGTKCVSSTGSLSGLPGGPAAVATPSSL